MQNWGEKWRARFLTWGMPIAVFGMRLIFPLAIVAIIAGIGPLETLHLALKNPTEYERILSGAHHQISAYGGTFLFMIFLKFFMNDKKVLHWIPVLESPLTKFGRLEAIQSAIILCLILFTARYIDAHEQLKFITAGILGLVTFILADAFGSLVGGEEEQGANKIIKEGVMGFIYLELLDASFSFDGVMGAFALSNNILIIALGLGVGAMFVRSLTLHLVKEKTLNHYRYLEHGAFWAIGALACITFLSVRFEIPEVVTGCVGAGLIGVSLWASILANRNEKKEN